MVRNHIAIYFFLHRNSHRYLTLKKSYEMSILSEIVFCLTALKTDVKFIQFKHLLSHVPTSPTTPFLGQNFYIR